MFQPLFILFRCLMTLVSIFSLFGIDNTFLGLTDAVKNDLEDDPTKEECDGKVEGQNIKEIVLIPSELVDW